MSSFASRWLASLCILSYFEYCENSKGILKFFYFYRFMENLIRNDSIGFQMYVDSLIHYGFQILFDSNVCQGFHIDDVSFVYIGFHVIVDS